MPKLKEIPPKQTLEVSYSDGKIENSTVPYYEITPRFKSLVYYLLSCYDGSIRRVTLYDNALRPIKTFENCMV